MIKHEQLIKIGQTVKPHGIYGEITLVTDFDIAEIVFSCFVFELDGIFVPFFAESIRNKKSNTFLIKFEGLQSEVEVSDLSNMDVYVLKSEFDENIELDNDGMYAEDFIGYNIIVGDNVLIGAIVDFDDTTDNALFIVKNQNDTEFFIPIADDFIVDIDIDNKIMTMNLPEGLLDL